MLYLDGRQGLSEFVLWCPDLSGWDEIPQPLVAVLEKGIKKESEVNHSLWVSHL